ncbi:hypothetical protein PINS_up007232 [Pythium insidiosum]|nr:hypothetical protein PINS_up007232 [Pythium insidiosum]
MSTAGALAMQLSVYENCTGLSPTHNIVCIVQPRRAARVLRRCLGRVPPARSLVEHLHGHRLAHPAGALQALARPHQGRRHRWARPCGALRRRRSPQRRVQRGLHHRSHCRGYVSAIPHGFNYTTLLTTLIFALNYVLVATFYRDPAPVADHAPTTAVNYTKLLVDAKNKLLEFRHIVHESGPAQSLLIARLLLAMAAILYRTHFSTLLEDKFGTDPKARGFVLSYMGFLGAFGSASVGLVTRAVRSERALLQGASIVYVATFLALSRAPSLAAVYVLLIPQVVSISMLRACSIGLQTTFVSSERVGAFMGVSSSLTVRAYQPSAQQTNAHGLIHSLAHLCTCFFSV